MELNVQNAAAGFSFKSKVNPPTPTSTCNFSFRDASSKLPGGGGLFQNLNDKPPVNLFATAGPSDSRSSLFPAANSTSLSSAPSTAPGNLFAASANTTVVSSSLFSSSSGPDLPSGKPLTSGSGGLFSNNSKPSFPSQGGLFSNNTKPSVPSQGGLFSSNGSLANGNLFPTASSNKTPGSLFGGSSQKTHTSSKKSIGSENEPTTSTGSSTSDGALLPAASSLSSQQQTVTFSFRDGAKNLPPTTRGLFGGSSQKPPPTNLFASSSKKPMASENKKTTSTGSSSSGGALFPAASSLSSHQRTVKNLPPSTGGLFFSEKQPVKGQSSVNPRSWKAEKLVGAKNDFTQTTVLADSQNVKPSIQPEPGRKIPSPNKSEAVDDFTEDLAALKISIPCKIYEFSQEEQLSIADVDAFEASVFSKGGIPLLPPPMKYLN